MSARDELADLIEDAVDDAIYSAADAPPSLTGIVAHHAADAVLAAGYRKPRTITTAEELDALPEGSVILSSGGDSAQKDGVGYWYLWGGDIGLESAEVALPAMVLHEPEATK